MSHASPPLPPGFRFHPTDEELILHYLCKRTASAPCPVQIIAEVDIYKFNPWDLPAKAKFGEREWYFFSPRDRKYPNGFRPNRAAASGYWKATGTDKPITASRSRKENIGVKKALVFYKGKPPKGVKTNWIMHEYRLSEALHNSYSKPSKTREAPMRLDDWVLCRIYQKSGHHPLAERREEDSGVQTLTNTNKMHKSFSISDLLIDDADFALLSRMLETPMNGHFAGHALLSNSNPNPFFAENNNGSYLVTESEDPFFVNKHCFEEKVSSSHVSSQFPDINQLAGSQTCFNPQADAQFSLGNALSLNIYQRNI